MEKVYVYKQFCDAYAYGEEIINVYENKADAEEALKMDVEEHYEMPWDNIPTEIGLDMYDTFEKNYVSIGAGREGIAYWIIEEKEIISTKERK
jgi:hypothetical protein